MEVIDNDSGEVIDKWSSISGTAHDVTVEFGKSYTLREVTAPLGYALTTDKVFSVDEDGNVTYDGNLTSDGVILCEDKLLVSDAKIGLTGTKKLKDGDISKYNFTFSVYDKDEYDAYKAGGDKPKAVSTATTKDAKPNKNGVVALDFSNIKYEFDDLKVYDDAGNLTKILDSKTYEYVIVEDIPETADKKGYDKESGIEYDTSERTLKVTISYDAEKAAKLVDKTDVKLSVTSNISKVNLDFTNSYTDKKGAVINKSAETGDTNLMLICIGLMLMSMLVIALMALRRVVTGRER